MFALLLPEIVIEVAYMTVESFFSRGVSVESIAESAKSSPKPYHELFCTIVFD